VLLVAAVLAACAPPPSRPEPATRDRRVVVRHLADEIASAQGRREPPTARIGVTTRYVLAELPMLPLEPADVAVTATGAGPAPVALRCPAAFAGQRVALQVSPPIVRRPERTAEDGFATLAVPPTLQCPVDPAQPTMVPVGGLDPGMRVSLTFLATKEPASRIETDWFRHAGEPTLRVSLGLVDPSSAGLAPVPARFRLSLESRDGRSVRLLERALDGDAAWEEERIALAPTGTEFRLVFETEPAGARRPAFPVWGDPTILVRAPATPLRRNVILVSIDTLRADGLGAYGAILSGTPTLDRLAAEGAVFDQAYAAAPWTLPSHTTMLTGLYGCVHGRGLRDGSLPSGISPLAELLRRAGYQTAAFTEDAQMSPADFQRGFGTFAARTPTWSEKGQVAETVASAVAWLARHADEPFFLFLHTYEVHAPYQAPPPYRDLLDGGDRTEACRPPAVQAAADRARYAEEIRYTDSVLADLFAALDALGLAGGTIVVVTSDHGEAFGEHGRFGHGSSLDEEVVRVPLIWRAPGLVAAGRRIRAVTSLADLVPTVLELLDLPLPTLLQGGSLAPLLRDVDPPVWEEAASRVAFSELLGGARDAVLVRGANWRVAFRRGRTPDGFFVHGKQHIPIARTSRVLSTAGLRRRRFAEECRRLAPLVAAGPPVAAAPVPDPDEIRALQALGYVQ
jgi:arylsulfatase A-like enzyme